MKSCGYESEATEVLIAKQDDLLRHGKLNLTKKLWKCFLKHTMAYGYKPRRALIWMICFVALGAGLFQWGYRNHLITSLAKNEFEAFFGGKHDSCTRRGVVWLKLHEFPNFLENGSDPNRLPKIGTRRMGSA